MRTVLKVFLENVIRDAVTGVWARDYGWGVRVWSSAR
jgi:hypothetical protein